MKSIKISKLGCKIMSGLTACIIGLSPCIGTQVFAAPVFIRSISQSKEIEDCTKEELLEVVPDVWERFWTARGAAMDATWAAADAARDAARDARDAARDARNTAWDAAWHARNTAWAAYDVAMAANDAANGTWTFTYEAVCGTDDGAVHDPARYVPYQAAENAARDAAGDARDTAWNAAFANAWRRFGAAYEIVKDNDRGYFENLVRVLTRQIVFLEDDKLFFLKI